MHSVLYLARNGCGKKTQNFLTPKRMPSTGDILNSKFDSPTYTMESTSCAGSFLGIWVDRTAWVKAGEMVLKLIIHTVSAHSGGGSIPIFGALFIT